MHAVRVPLGSITFCIVVPFCSNRAMVRRRRKQDVVAASIELVGQAVRLSFTLLVIVVKAAEQACAALVRLLRKVQPRTATAAKKKNDWRQATLQVGSGQDIYKALKKEYAGPTGKAAKKYFLESCARTRITSNLSPQLLYYIQSENLKGQRPESIASGILRKLPGHDEKDVERMVRTAVGMVSTAFERARAEELGLEWYAWESAQDARVRDSHRNMNGVLASWNDPPSPEQLIGEASLGRYHPGETEDCRCIALPILGLDGIHWPARVYRNGRIVSMSRQDFQRLSGIPK
jgi:SPP1 gp7 family putative phage head morphogenesis protein